MNAESPGRNLHALKVRHVQNAAFVLDMGKVGGTRNLLLVLAIRDRESGQLEVSILFEGKIDSLRESMQRRTVLGSCVLECGYSRVHTRRERDMTYRHRLS